MKEFIKNIKFVWQYARDQKSKLVKDILCNLIAVIISVVVPIISAKIIVYLTDSMFYQLLFMTVVLCFLELLRNIVNYFSRSYSTIIFRESFIKIQTELGQNILKLENKVIDSNSSGVFIQRLTSDTSRLADIFNVLNLYLSRILINIGIFIAVFIINFWAFLYMIVMVLILYLIEKRRVQIYNRRDKEFRKETERVTGFVGEIVRGIRDIKMLHSEGSFSSELHSQVEELNQTRYQMMHVNNKYNCVRFCLQDILDMGLIFLLVFLIIEGNLTVANALVVHNYQGRVTSIIDVLGILLQSLKDFNLSCDRVFSIMHSDKFSKERFGSTHLDKVNGDFCFSHVDFHYDSNEKKVLNDLNFQVHANETVAFVGKSGAGKTTIFNLLCRMYDIDNGMITIDGIDIRELDQDSIRGNITIISQSPYIFHLSIRDNLRLVAPKMTEHEMIKACKLACIHDFIMSLPDGYDTIVGEGGVNLSGGQKQRLAIARAFLQKTEIILFDEATSALDNETQKEIQMAINNLKKDYTILIVAHRLSTIIDSDRILFIENGHITAEGSHKELLRKSKGYRELYEAELKNQE